MGVVQIMVELANEEGRLLELTEPTTLLKRFEVCHRKGRQAGWEGSVN